MKKLSTAILPKGLNTYNLSDLVSSNKNNNKIIVGVFTNPHHHKDRSNQVNSGTLSATCSDDLPKAASIINLRMNTAKAPIPNEKVQ